MTRTPRNHAGIRYGSIVAIKPVGKIGKSIAWLYQCDCGEQGVARSSSLPAKTRCAKCAREQQAQKITIHGETINPKRSSLYNTWLSIRQRCNNPKHLSYKDYGGRGIKLCERWNSFDMFKLDVGEKPAPHMQINRIDNNGNYEPGNVEWATPSQNSNNRRSSRLIEYKGKAMTLRAWCDELGLSYPLMKQRMVKKWDVEIAFTTPYIPRIDRARFGRIKH